MNQNEWGPPQNLSSYYLPFIPSGTHSFAEKDDPSFELMLQNQFTPENFEKMVIQPINIEFYVQYVDFDPEIANLVKKRKQFMLEQLSILKDMIDKMKPIFHQGNRATKKEVMKLLFTFSKQYQDNQFEYYDSPEQTKLDQMISNIRYGSIDQISKPTTIQNGSNPPVIPIIIAVTAAVCVVVIAFIYKNKK